jgi:hypothetical protein
VKEAIGIESNVLAHDCCIHTHEVEWEHHFVDEAFFDFDGIVDNLPDADRARRFEQAIVEDTAKVTVKSFIVADEIVCKHRPGSTPHCVNQKMAQMELGKICLQPTQQR